MYMTTLVLCVLLLAFITVERIYKAQQAEARVVVRTDQRRRIPRHM